VVFLFSITGKKKIYPWIKSYIVDLNTIQKFIGISIYSIEISIKYINV